MFCPLTLAQPKRTHEEAFAEDEGEERREEVESTRPRKRPKTLPDPSSPSDPPSPSEASSASSTASVPAAPVHKKLAKRSAAPPARKDPSPPDSDDDEEEDDLDTNRTNRNRTDRDRNRDRDQDLGASSDEEEIQGEEVEEMTAEEMMRDLLGEEEEGEGGPRQDEDEEGEGEDLFGSDMEADYEDMPELDRYDEEGLWKPEDGEVAPLSAKDRRLAERLMSRRDRLSSLLSRSRSSLSAPPSATFRRSAPSLFQDDSDDDDDPLPSSRRPPPSDDPLLSALASLDDSLDDSLPLVRPLPFLSSLSSLLCW